MLKKKVLITGGTGYIGNYITKVLAATKPEYLIISMSRRPVDDQRRRDEQTSMFTNVKFHQGDCLKAETYPEEMNDCEAIIHTVGTLIEGVDYKSLLNGGIDSILKKKVNPMEIFQKLSSSIQPKYDESHEAINRDSCKLIAEHFNNACKQQNRKGHFVFLSAARSIAPMLTRYTVMKE